MLDTDERYDLVALLAWHRDMGVDAVIGEEPIDWLARDQAVPGSLVRDALRSTLATRNQALSSGQQPGKQGAAAQSVGTPISTPSSSQPRRRNVTPAPPRLKAPAQPARRFPTKAPDEAVLSAGNLARKAQSLGELQDMLATFDGCALKATAKSLCFYRGAAQAPIMVIGEAPGRDEDLEGRPFVGRAGQLLDRMLAAIGLDESNCHITNIVYWRPPGNRTPTPQEALICRPFLERQVELVSPKIVFLLGGAAAKNVLGATDGIMKLRGKWRNPVLASKSAEPGIDDAPPLRALATLHPAYLLRTPAAKRLAWRDLLMIKTALADEER